MLVIKVIVNLFTMSKIYNSVKKLHSSLLVVKEYHYDTSNVFHIGTCTKLVQLDSCTLFVLKVIILTHMESQDKLMRPAEVVQPWYRPGP